MNNILAAQILKRHLPDIKDESYKRATEIAIEVLYKDTISNSIISSQELQKKNIEGLTEKDFYFESRVGSANSRDSRLAFIERKMLYPISDELKSSCKKAGRLFRKKENK